MNKAFDKDRGGRDHWIAWLRDIMKESLRVCRPGGHALVWSLPRTQHWTMMALEDAGWEIRDSIVNVQSQGFPKNMNLSRAIDQHYNLEPKVIGLRPDAAKLNKSIQESESGWVTAQRHPELTEPVSEEAKKYQGFGTALKPAQEGWILCRKPISEKTIVENMLKHGTGGINIDACRISTSDNLNGGAYAKNGTDRDDGWHMERGGAGEYQQPTGRWPANFILTHGEGCKLVGTKKVKGSKPAPPGLNRYNKANQGQGYRPNDYHKEHPNLVNNLIDEDGYETHEYWECVEGCPVKLLDEQSGVRKSGTGAIKKSTAKGYQGNAYGKESRPEGTEMVCYGDEGGASRFFKQIEYDPFVYMSKASRKDKGANNHHPCLLPGELVYTETGLTKIEDTKAGQSVYTIDGVYNKVKDAFSSPCDDIVCKIEVDGINVSTTATSNHPFLVWKANRKNRRIIGGDVRWEIAGDLKPGDYLLTPLLQCQPHSNHPLYEKSNDWWFTAGLWLAEGSLSTSNNRTKTKKYKYPSFALGSHEHTLVDKISKVFKLVGIYPRKDSKGMSVVAFCQESAENFVLLCGKGAKNKYVSHLVMYAPEEKRKSFLEGYLSGDGCVVNGKYRAKTSSQSLAATISLLAESLGYKAGWYKHDSSSRISLIKGRKIKQGIYFQVYLYPKKGRNRPKFIKYQNREFSIRRIKKISRFHYDGPVWNLTVEPSHTFQTIVGMSHNTTKNSYLMEYFAKLICPPGGTVLDVFMGSGSTGVGVLRAGFKFIGIELEQEYFEVAKERISAAVPQDGQQL